jgi:hypothetical protein
MAVSQIRGSTQILDGSITNAKLAGSITTANLVDGANFIKKDGTVAFTANQSLGNFKFTDLADATNPQDAVNLRTAQGLINGIALQRADYVSTVNQALSGLPTPDGTAMTAGQIILLTGQTTASQNGPWAVAAGSWTRPSNWEAASTQKSTMWFVDKGTTYHDTKWIAITDSITVDTTNVTITQDQSGTAYTNGSGLSLTGNTFAVKLLSTGGLSFDGGSNIQITLNGSSLNVGASGLKISDSASSGQVMIGNGSNAATFTSLSGDISTISGTGVVTLAATVYKSSNFVDNETPSGTINGTNPTFTLANTPTVGSERIYLNGQRLFPGAGNDYTISGATITMLTIPLTGDRLTADYRK